jgi:hypothetical protein
MPAVIRQKKIIAIDKDGGTWRVTYRIFEKNYYLPWSRGFEKTRNTQASAETPTDQ